MGNFFVQWWPFGAACIGGTFIFILVQKIVRMLEPHVRSVRTSFNTWHEDKNGLWPKFQAVPSNSLVRVLRFAGYRRRVPSTKALVGSVGVCMCFVLFLSVRFFVYSVAGLGLVWWRLQKKAQRTENKIIEQIPEMLTSIAESLRAGFSFSQAVSFVSSELPNPIAPVFRSVVRGLTRGLPVTDCFKAVSAELGVVAFTDTMDCIGAGLLSGGNIVPLLYSQANAVSAWLKSEREIKSHTAAGRSSGYIIALLAPVVFLFFWFFSPSYAHVFLDTLLGKVLLSTSGILEILGFVWIQKIVRRV